jgi:hypothetical protein
MNRETVRLGLVHAGLLAGSAAAPVAAFRRRDGSPGRVDQQVMTLASSPADVLHSGPPADPDLPLVVQVSRLDRRKDMTGVMVAFTERVAPHCDAQLLLAGPAVTEVVDDPEGAQVFDECVGGVAGVAACDPPPGSPGVPADAGSRGEGRVGECAATPCGGHHPKEPRAGFRVDRRGSDEEAPAGGGQRRRRDRRPARRRGTGFAGRGPTRFWTGSRPRCGGCWTIECSPPGAVDRRTSGRISTSWPTVISRSRAG